MAANVLAHGTGAINIDGCRIESPDADLSKRQVNFDAMGYHGASDTEGVATYKPGGRWPANVLLDEEAAALLDATVGDAGGGFGANTGRPANVYGTYAGLDGGTIGYGDRGGPSRFFYTAKASRSEREAGLEDLPPALRTDGRPPEGPGADNPRLLVSERRNDHPTVKPVSLMRWLCKLITPPGGVVLDPFLGSGTTGMAALDEGFQFIGIDMTERYVEIARYRVTHRHVLEVEVKESDEGMPQGRLF